MSNLVRFDSFEVDLPAGKLYRRGLRIHLRDKSFQILARLLEHPGDIVTREGLRQILWGEGVYVDFENNLNTAIACLREALGDSAEHPRFIETLPRHGYRFIGNVSMKEAAAANASKKKAQLLVMPFINLTGDPGQEYFSDAMTDEIITALAAIAPQQLAIIARTTAMHYKNTHKDVACLGRELGVDYVVEGGVLCSDDRLSVNVQLIDARNQTHLFAHKYNAEMVDIFELHREVAQAVALRIPTIVVALGQGTSLRNDNRKKPTNNLAAYNEYIKGR